MSVEGVRGLHSVRDHQNFSHKFFENLEELEFEEVDNYVLDVSVVYSMACGRKYTSALFEENDSLEDVNRILGRDSFDEHKSDAKIVQQYVSTPYSRAHSLADLAEDSDFYLPNTIEDCLSRSQRDIRNQNEITAAFEDISSPLGVKEILGVDTYSREELKEAELKDEDLATARAADELDGNTLILTYDSDFLDKLDREEFEDSDIYATVPEIAQTLNNTRTVNYREIMDIDPIQFQPARRKA